MLWVRGFFLKRPAFFLIRTHTHAHTCKKIILLLSGCGRGRVTIDERKTRLRDKEKRKRDTASFVSVCTTEFAAKLEGKDSPSLFGFLCSGKMPLRGCYTRWEGVWIKKKNRIACHAHPATRYRTKTFFFLLFFFNNFIFSSIWKLLAMIEALGTGRGQQFGAKMLINLAKNNTC